MTTENQVENVKEAAITEADVDKAAEIWNIEKAVASKIVDDANAKFYAVRDAFYAQEKAKKK